VSKGEGSHSEAVSFPIPLGAALDASHVHNFTEANFADFDGAGAGTAGCKGTIANPTAPSGNLCVYGEGVFGANVETLLVLAPGGGEALLNGEQAASRAGAWLFVVLGGGGSFALADGTWAVTG
jgi:hypothetical protein